jgi:hypothetical protein
MRDGAPSIDISPRLGMSEFLKVQKERKETQTNYYRSVIIAYVLCI